MLCRVRGTVYHQSSYHSVELYDAAQISDCLIRTVYVTLTCGYFFVSHRYCGVAHPLSRSLVHVIHLIAFDLKIAAKPIDGIHLSEFFFQIMTDTKKRTNV